jgi:predicted acetyltransferase
MINLRFPTEEDIDQINIVCNAPWALEYGFTHFWESRLFQDAKALIRFLPLMQKGEELKSPEVACTFLYAFNKENKIVGRTSIRHELNDHLYKDGGHIGYAVVPEFRKQGIATDILKQSLQICREFNIQVEGKVLITCDDDNLGSIKTIEKNRGVLLDKFSLVAGKPLKRRYWITL